MKFIFNKQFSLFLYIVLLQTNFSKEILFTFENVLNVLVHTFIALYKLIFKLMRYLFI